MIKEDFPIKSLLWIDKFLLSVSFIYGLWDIISHLTFSKKNIASILLPEIDIVLLNYYKEEQA